MKFEFVEFYPITDKNRGPAKKNTVGTLHIYAIDCQLDIRGIRIIKNGSSLFFNIPHFKGIDEEGKKVSYPLIRWTNNETHKEMMDFLHNEIKPKLKEILHTKSKK